MSIIGELLHARKCLEQYNKAACDARREGDEDLALAYEAQAFEEYMEVQQLEAAARMGARMDEDNARCDWGNEDVWDEGGDE